MEVNKKLSLESKIGDLYNSPVGHDALAKVLLQLGISEKVITNRLVSNMKLKYLAKIANKPLGNDFFEALLNLVNTENDIPVVSNGKITKKNCKFGLLFKKKS